MTLDVRFVLLATYATGFDAEVARATLEAEGVPVLVKGQHVGLFGAGFQGAMMGGVELHVPSPELARAREMLEE